MAVRFAEGSPMEQFQAGASLAGPNSLGLMIKGMMDTVTKMQGMQVEQRFKSRQIREEAQVKSQADIAAQRELLPMKEASAMRLMQEKARLFPPKAGGTANRAQGIAETGIAKLNRIREMLGSSSLTDPLSGKSKTFLTDRGPITTGAKPGFLKSTREKELRDTHNATLDLLALLRTGTAGEEAQVNRLKSEYNIGATDTDQTILNRLNAMEEEFRGFSLGTIPSPVNGQAQGSQFLTRDDLDTYDRSQLEDIAHTLRIEF